MRSLARPLGFATLTAFTALSLLAVAEPPRKPPPTTPKPPAVAPRKPPAGKPPAPARPSATAGATTTSPDDVDAAAPLAAREDTRPIAAASKDAGQGGAILEQRTLDGGARVFRFGEVELETRLKSPQIVYFLRRVRAEFAAGDLGHRTFLHELDETKGEPGF